MPASALPTLGIGKGKGEVACEGKESGCLEVLDQISYTSWHGVGLTVMRTSVSAEDSFSS